MSQNLPIDSRTQSSKIPGLKPPLAAALASLEVQLDQELARYRRTRDTSRLANPRVVSYIGSSPQAIAAAILEQSQTGEIKLPTPPAPVMLDPQVEAATDTVQFEELDHLQLSSTPEVATTLTPPPPPPPPIPPTPSTPPTPASSIVRTGQPDEDDTLLQPDDTPREPDNYLESSEALLRSVTDEESPAKRPNSSSNDGILSPLGIGSMLLLLVASLTLGYVVFNPKSLTQLKLSNVFNGKSSAPADNTTSVATNIQTQPETLLTPIPKYPNLAAKEFPEVKDPNDIVGLTPKGQANTAALPNQIPAQKVAPPVQPPTGLSAPQPANPTVAAPLQTLEPADPINPPTSSVNSAPVVLNPQTKPSADGFYHVVIDNQNERTFASVRQVIPDAYLSTDNRLIFLGAFKTQKEVQQHLQLLQKRGIQARVQQP
ncbi:hypothetical protein H6G27_08270 [Nostoc linckia FACHB-104]|nr:hypothetical protein [Nostoc linckia FACHB-104]